MMMCAVLCGSGLVFLYAIDVDRAHEERGGRRASPQWSLGPLMSSMSTYALGSFGLCRSATEEAVTSPHELYSDTPSQWNPLTSAC